MLRATNRLFAYALIGDPPPAMKPDDTYHWLTILKTQPERMKEAAHKLILGHVRFAGSIAARYTAKVPSKGEDIMAFALYTLVDSTYRIGKGELMTHHDNYDAYLQVVLSRAISRYLNQDYIVKPPTNDPKILEEEIRTNPEEFKDKYTPRELSDVHSVSPMNYDLIIEDIVVRSEMFTSREQLIIMMRLEDYEDTDIGKKIGLTRQQVCNIRLGLKSRLERLTGMKA